MRIFFQYSEEEKHYMTIQPTNISLLYYVAQKCLWEQMCESQFFFLFDCMTCTALPNFCLAFFSLFPMASLLKLHIGYKICLEVELSYCSGNLVFLQQKQNAAVFHVCYCWHNRHCLFSPSTRYCKMTVSYFSIYEGNKILFLLHHCLTIK